MEERIKEELQEIEKAGLKRRLVTVCPNTSGRISVDGHDYINLSSNDYLGMSEHKKVIKAAQKASEPAFGTASSRLMTGNMLLHEVLEQKIAYSKKKPEALVFNSGYQLNIGVISTLFKKGDVIFADKLSHASIIDGIILSGAKYFRFRHNDTEHLETLMAKERPKYKEALVVTESVFSMDGDIAPLKEIARIKEKYDASLMVDEAHATGMFGPTGAGMIEELGLEKECDLVMGTFSKALGGFGAYIASTSNVREYLINKCRSFIYSTALPVSVISANIVALTVAKNERYKAHEVLKSAEYLRTLLKEKGFKVLGESQIVPIVIGDAAETVKSCEALKKKGYWVTPVRPPTVPKGSSRLRVSVTYSVHTKNILDRFVDDISGIKGLKNDRV